MISLVWGPIVALLIFVLMPLLIDAVESIVSCASGYSKDSIDLALFGDQKAKSLKEGEKKVVKRK